MCSSGVPPGSSRLEPTRATKGLAPESQEADSEANRRNDVVVPPWLGVSFAVASYAGGVVGGAAGRGGGRSARAAAARRSTGIAAVAGLPLRTAASPASARRPLRRRQVALQAG